ncbi:MAG: glycosyltransferase family 2 protein [DPANN group archaeon]|nr:glycosyltransferase family 2 protein [DPANN group archaeon]
MKKLSGISGFLLAYNEEENIEKAVLALVAALKANAARYEAMVVLYEKSTDNTASIVRKLAKNNSHVRLVMQPCSRKGYGNAIRIGIEHARCPYIFFSDADNQFDFRDIGKLARYADSYQIVTGYRTDRKDPFVRRLTARIYNTLLKLIFPIPVKDIDCAFKLYQKDIFRNMELVCTTGMVNAEIITKAAIKKAAIKEVPIPHYHRFAGRPVFEANKWAIIKPKVVMDLLKEMKVLWKTMPRR